MNNNQDNFNINPQPNNINSSNSNPNMFFNNQNGFIQNQPETLNVIPQQNPQPMNQGQQMMYINQTTSQEQPQNIIFEQQNQNSSFFNNGLNANPDNNINEMLNNNQMPENNMNEQIQDDDRLHLANHNRFINSQQNNTMLNDLNVEGEYNGMPKVDYSKDPKVVKNIEEEKKKNTITITGEAKVFLVIIAVLLLFTFVMPIIFDLIRNIHY